MKKSLDTSNLESEQEVNDLPLPKRRRIHQTQPPERSTSSEDSDSSSDQREDTYHKLPPFTITSVQDSGKFITTSALFSFRKKSN